MELGLTAGHIENGMPSECDNSPKKMFDARLIASRLVSTLTTVSNAAHPWPRSCDQARDQRERSSRPSWRKAGDADAMLLPVVFLILPVTVIFASIRVSSPSFTPVNEADTKGIMP